MNTISYRKIREFAATHPDAKTALHAWYKIVKKAQWNNLADLKSDFPQADLVDGQMVFNIRGNNYRLIAYVNYQYKQVLIKHVLTHEEYDRKKWKA